MTRYGYTTIGIVTIIVFILLVAGILIQNNYVKYSLILISLLIMLFTINFFRDPDRNPPSLDNVVVSPADGTVVLVKKVFEENYLKENAWQISIFMSPLNVHVNRIPIDGKIEYVKYIEGDYLIATDDKASERNERAEFGILSKHCKVFFTQVAGYVARRIIYEVKEGDSVKMGNRFGMIKFGSRVDVVIPEKCFTPDLHVNLKIKKGDKVKAGETILFEFKK